MMIAVVLLVSLASAYAFVPAGRAVGSLMKMEFAGGLPGADGPEMKKFDPLKFSENTPEWTLFFRESELKHGRIAMLATAGIITASFVRLPGSIYTAGTVIDAHNNAVASGPMWQLLFWCSLIEIITTPAVYTLGKNDRKPGFYAFDPLNLGKNPKNLAKYEINELKNGRLAMLAFSGIITQSVLYNKPDFPFF